MSNLFDLSGRNAMIFGGAGGLGKLIAKAYAEAGANVAIASRGEEKLKAACEELKAETGKEFRYYVCDATDENAVEETARRANAEMGPVTILVNSQGINKKLPVLEFPVDESVVTAEYCTESGGLAAPGCPRTATGYYTQGNLPAVCRDHAA